MSSSLAIGLFWFRRDLRLVDNQGLAALCELCDRVLPVFCLDPRQLDLTRNPYGGSAAVRFLFESLVDLDAQVGATGLTLLRGLPHQVLPQAVRALLRAHPHATVHVAWNEDVTPFSRRRDQEVTAALAGVGAAAVAKKGRRTEKANGGQNSEHAVVTARKTRRAPTPAPARLRLHPCATDVTVVPVLPLRTGTGGLYTVFTPFCRKARALGVALPLDADATRPRHGFVGLPPQRTSKRPPTVAVASLLSTGPRAPFRQALTHNPPTDVAVHGGRTEGRKRLSKAYLQRRCQRYDLERDTPGQEHTTRLSAHLKYGCVSFREAHLAALTALKGRPKASEALTRELFWAAFYAYITYHFPHVLAGQGVVAGAGEDAKTSAPAPAANRALQTTTANQPLRTALHGKLASVWDGGGSAAERERRWRAWTTGTTGYPFVDAAMRQLHTTGWMHNRARMVVANFLTKDLRIDWREGERHFATRLVDYDPSSNSGGWQWASATGADAQPYHRVFNPWTQGVKFDADAAYVHRYVPELQTVPAEALAKWDRAEVRAQYAACGYAAPIVEHGAARVAFLAAWKGAVG